jgi:hypothetical protein
MEPRSVADESCAKRRADRKSAAALIHEREKKDAHLEGSERLPDS